MPETFTEIVGSLSNESRADAIAMERKKRVAENPEKYVMIPLAIPKPGTGQRSQLEGVPSVPPEITVGWAVGCPGIVELGERKLRESMQLAFTREDTAEDFCHLMNTAKLDRERVEAAGFKL